MIAYGIIDRQVHLTEFGQRLSTLRADEPALYATLGQHILRELHGTTLVQCILDMQAAGETVDLPKLREWLGERGIHFPRGGKHPSMMRLWLEKAGVFVSGWRVDTGRFQELVGLAEDELEALARFSPQQRAYLKTLANMGGVGPYPSNEVEKLAHTTYGTSFNEKSLPKDVLYPLRDAGFFTLGRGTVEEGRGSRPFLITPTDKLTAEVITPLLGQLEQQVNADLRPFLRRPLADVIAEVGSPDKHIRGLALEGKEAARGTPVFSCPWLSAW